MSNQLIVYLENATLPELLELRKKVNRRVKETYRKLFEKQVQKERKKWETKMNLKFFKMSFNDFDVLYNTYDNWVDYEKPEELSDLDYSAICFSNYYRGECLTGEQSRIKRLKGTKDIFFCDACLSNRIHENHCDVIYEDHITG